MTTAHLPEAPKPFDTEWVDKRTPTDSKPEPPEVHGSVKGFVPSPNRVLVKRLPKTEMAGSIIKPQVTMEQSERGHVVALGPEMQWPPIGSLASFGKFGAEEKNFDDQGSDEYALVWIDDIRGWHAAD